MGRCLLSRLLHKLDFIDPGGFSLRPWNHIDGGATIGKKVWISQLVYSDELHPEGMFIVDNATIGPGTSIFTHFY
jgi:heptaprenylglycerol acetyltransferase